VAFATSPRGMEVGSFQAILTVFDQASGKRMSSDEKLSAMASFQLQNSDVIIHS